TSWLRLQDTQNIHDFQDKKTDNALCALSVFLSWVSWISWVSCNLNHDVEANTTVPTILVPVPCVSCVPCVFVFCPYSLSMSRKRALVTTDTELIAIAAAATMGFSHPIVARGIPTQL